MQVFLRKEIVFPFRISSALTEVILKQKKQTNVYIDVSAIKDIYIVYQCYYVRIIK